MIALLLAATLIAPHPDPSPVYHRHPACVRNSHHAWGNHPSCWHAPVPHHWQLVYVVDEHGHVHELIRGEHG